MKKSMYAMCLVTVASLLSGCTLTLTPSISGSGNSGLQSPPNAFSGGETNDTPSAVCRPAGSQHRGENLQSVTSSFHEDRFLPRDYATFAHNRADNSETVEALCDRVEEQLISHQEICGRIKGYTSNSPGATEERQTELQNRRSSLLFSCLNERGFGHRVVVTEGSTDSTAPTVDFQRRVEIRYRTSCGNRTNAVANHTNE